MSTTYQTKLLFPQLSLLLDRALQSRSLRATTVVHSHLLKTGLIPHLHTKLFLSYANSVSYPESLPPLSCLLNSTSPDVGSDPLPWNAVVSALSQRGFSFLALRTFCLMHKLGFSLCSYALCSALAACSAEMSAQVGKLAHAYSIKSGWVSAIFVSGALVNLYAKLNAIDEARYVFDEIPTKNIMCMNTLMMGYVAAKLWSDGLMLVREMHVLGLIPDSFTLSMVLRMCGEMPAASLGMQVHAYIIRRSEYLEGDVVVQSSLVEMYGKCGLVSEAQLVFDLPQNVLPRKRRDVVLWTSMLNAYGRNGWFTKVIEMFEEMLNVGTKPDEVAFVAVLTACSRTGNVTRALHYFKSMREEHQIFPWPEHYGCIIDLLCKAGESEEVWKFANEMVLGEENGSEANSVRVWGALLSACKEFGNVEMGKLAAQRALQQDPNNVGIFIELSNLFANKGMWDQIELLREHLNKRGLKKDVGFSWLEIT